MDTKTLVDMMARIWVAGGGNFDGFVSCSPEIRCRIQDLERLTRHITRDTDLGTLVDMIEDD
jgi:hypothetical protein